MLSVYFQLWVASHAIFLEAKEYVTSYLQCQRWFVDLECFESVVHHRGDLCRLLCKELSSSRTRLWPFDCSNIQTLRRRQCSCFLWYHWWTCLRVRDSSVDLFDWLRWTSPHPSMWDAIISLTQVYTLTQLRAALPIFSDSINRRHYRTIEIVSEIKLQNIEVYHTINRVGLEVLGKRRSHYVG